MVEYTQRKLIDGRDYSLWLVAVMLVSMGVTLTLFSVAYIRDLETLRTVPNAIWDAICGRPDPESLTLPILLTAATLCYLGGAGVYLYKRIRGAQLTPDV